MKRLIFILTLTVLIFITGFLWAQENEKPISTTEEVHQIVSSHRIDTGDTAWMIVATALVMLMTIPGLAVFYGGLTKKKDALNPTCNFFP